MHARLQGVTQGLGPESAPTRVFELRQAAVGGQVLVRPLDHLARQLPQREAVLGDAALGHLLQRRRQLVP
jgi:hypothetical protein